MTSQTGTGFLKFNSLPPRLHLTADDDDFDPTLLAHFHSEGYDVTYLPLGAGGKPYRNELAHLADDLELGESYAIVAFGHAAAECLDFHIKPQPKLAALVAYYPSSIPNPKTKYPPHLEVLCHIAGTQGFAPAFPSFTYRGAEPGFAEHDLETFDKVAAGLAWSRTLGLVRKGFKLVGEIDLVPVRERHTASVYARRDAEGALSGMTEDAYVNNVATMTGGIGQRELLSFYRDYFIPQNPPSLNMKLVSRTAGVDRVVDEFIVSFKHTQVVDWILPGVQPTNKQVHVAVVSIVCVRGGKLCHEHVYWDQASVLVQVGLLDPKLVPESFKKQGLKRLPVYGSETASKILDEEIQPSNALIASWNDKASGKGKQLPNRPKPAANGGQASDT
ncbi:hypothetical protein M409DRAFT_62064 [Zasmidium cellare ATCC 36951]|uniref:SnoaL-like domain-containing protein n=1 Tax=Zasmidium cellare ATCC 36951 TaxID=1080233 RepID=A0A6A6D440_ZASCE|nr:uncharacterized protein M409DRAFT_62064 [Zasmidium cellare ATCC 36951]KAF2173815.1 hypothetical protein M409DRAFT_62064 [Zasmidium cellare ATCC 36951]